MPNVRALRPSINGRNGFGNLSESVPRAAAVSQRSARVSQDRLDSRESTPACRKDRLCCRIFPLTFPGETGDNESQQNTPFSSGDTTMSVIEKTYALAKERYAQWNIDTDQVLDR